MTDLSGRLLQGRYQIVRKIGEGAMSEVYLAVEPRNADVRYAIKVLKRELTRQSTLGQRFREESQVLKRLAHPGILRVHGYFEEGGSLCMVLDFVEGQSLAELLDKNGALESEVALPIFQVILSALDTAHRAGVIHRDIKPSNILIDKKMRPQLCDFGIARQVGQRGLTGTGMTLGTPHYMSPEQITSPQNIDHRSDLYSAGIMLYEILTGKVPFGDAPGASDYAILQQHVQADPPDPRLYNARLDPRLCDVLEKALRKDRDRRFQGASEFWQAIERTLVDGATIAGDPPAPPPSDDAGPSAHYAVYHHPSRGHEAVRIGFSWPALWLDFVWMLSKDLFGHALLWLACWVVLGLLLFLAMGSSQDAGSTVMAALLILVMAAIWLLPGLRGNVWLEDLLVRRGYRQVADVNAASAESAVAQAKAAHR